MRNFQVIIFIWIRINREIFKSVLEYFYDFCQSQKVHIRLTREIRNGHHLYAMRLLHIFEIPTISNGKPSISIKIPSSSIKNLGFRSKY